MAKIFISYISWHYTSAIREIFVVWRNFILFLWEAFSVPLLVRTFFSPWKRLDEEKPDLFKPKAFLSALIINIFTRMIGAIFRFIVLMISFISLFIVLVAGALMFLLWPFMPVILLAGLVVGLYLLL